jgi:protein ImuB
MPSLRFASLFHPRAAGDARGALEALAQEFSPRYEMPRADLVTIDVSGLDRLIGPPPAIGAELAREAATRGLEIHAAVASTHTAAAILALSRSGVTIVEAGHEAAALAPVAIDILEPFTRMRDAAAECQVPALKAWGLRTLGEFAALPQVDLVARLGRHAIAWHAVARGEDTRPIVPAQPEERFDATCDLEWPIDTLEPLSFVLTRLLEPLSTRLERRDRGAAVLHVVLQLAAVTAGGGEVYARRLELPTPMRDVRTLRTLALLDLESHPPPGSIERVTVAIDPTPGRVLQHTLFARAHPTPERLSTLLARLGALMGQDRVGAAALVDSHRPGAFTTTAYATDHSPGRVASRTAESPPPAPGVVSVLRRCRHPVPARVVTELDRPVRVTTDRRGFTGGAVVHAAGPWRTSGNWWEPAGQAGAGRAGEAGEAGRAGAAGRAGESGRSGESGRKKARSRTYPPYPTYQPYPTYLAHPTYLAQQSWSRDEWDVSLSDGGVYRIFRDRDTDGWFIDGIFD